MLGFYFEEKPSVNAQIEHLIKKTNKRLHLLTKLKLNGLNKEKLRIIYMASMRGVLEYSSNTYHSQINKGQINAMESIQKKWLKIIFGYNHSYEKLLELGRLERLETRRQKLFEKFPQKTIENPKYQHWFPLKTFMRHTRHPRPYIETKANTNRLHRSPMYAMRRFLNDEKPIQPENDDITGAYNEP